MFLIYENATTERKDNETTKFRNFIFDEPTDVRLNGSVHEGVEEFGTKIKRGEKVYATNHPIQIK